jgi:F420-dependent oxidoreductase-like protein
MRVGVSSLVATPEHVDFVVEAERCGVDSVWVPEMWGQDALTPLAYLAARTTTIKLATGIAQIGARTPAALAMAAMSMQLLSDGRFILGLGTSGPQVMEAWHGLKFRSPVTTTRETIEIVRAVARGERLIYDGDVYKLPLPGGAGRPMRTMLAPSEVPIYVAALGPLNLRMTGELADGWIGNAFVPERAEVFLREIASGALAAGRSLADLDLVMPVAVEFTDDVDTAAKRHSRGYAFTIGAMGSRDHNFYTAAFERQGFGDDVRAVQELWLAGRKEEAEERVPVELGLKTNLLGTPEMVKARLRVYRDAGINTIQMKPSGDSRRAIEDAAQLVELVQEVNRESEA